MYFHKYLSLVDTSNFLFRRKLRLKLVSLSLTLGVWSNVSIFTITHFLHKVKVVWLRKLGQLVQGEKKVFDLSYSLI